MNLARYFGLDMQEKFPVITMVITMMCVVIFLFTTNNLPYYESSFGFIPASPRIYTLLTYSFIHANMAHLISNVIMLILLGIILENYIDNLSYVLIYMTSGVVSAVFDTVSRGVLSISPSLPFVGASGAIFGLAGVAMLVKPYEKLPSFTVLLFAVPLFMLVSNYSQLLTNPFAMLLVLMFVGLTTAIVLFEIPSLPTLVIFFYYTVFTILFILMEGFTQNVSYIGHLGGLLGGVLSFFLFCRKGK